MKNRVAQYIITVVATLGGLALGAVAFVDSGLYKIGADNQHTTPVLAMLQRLRDRSIERRAADIKVPNLDDPR